MSCYDCDGRGWMYDTEFREYVDGEHLGDEPPLFYFDVLETWFMAICPSCEGYGK